MLNVFSRWEHHVETQRRKYIINQELCEKHNRRRLLMWSFMAWKKIPVLIKEERMRTKRLDDMRRKVVEILPDFRPASVSDTSHFPLF